jgi:hypothetical protein
VNGSDLHRRALEYAVGAGFAVFPCRPGTKRPACANGVHDATSDVAQIDAWWTENPDYNIGWDPHFSGHCIIDTDGLEGESALAGLGLTHSDLPPTLTVQTPRGVGHTHRVFRGVLLCTQSKLATHVDTRGNGDGYGLLPPSLIDGRSGKPEACWGSYSVLEDCKPAPVPKWVSEALQARHQPKQLASASVQQDSRANRRRAERYLKTCKPAIEGSGGDRRTYQIAAELRGLGLSEEAAVDMMDEHQGFWCVGPWDRDGLAVKVGNAYKFSQNEAGCNAPDGDDSFAPLVAGLGPEYTDDAPAETRRLTFKHADVADYPAPKSAAELSAGTFPRAEYALDNLLLYQHVNLIYGDGGSGKTLLTETWAVAIAAGLPWCGYATKQMPVLLVLAEDDDGETKARLEAICAVSELDLASLPITVWCLPGYDANIARIADDGSWEPGPFLDPLKAELERLGPCFLVLDTVSDIAALDETKRLPVNTLCKVVMTGELCRAAGATVAVNAHPSKAAMSDGSGYAGSTAWNNAVRNRLTLERPDVGSPRRILKVAKANYGQNIQIELFLVGLTFVTGKETAAADRNALLREACVKVALAAAEQGAPIQKQRRLNKWMLDEIEAAAGYRPTDRDVKEELASAMHAGMLRHVRSANDRTAGYYPVDQVRAAELAREAKHRTVDGRNA